MTFNILIVSINLNCFQLWKKGAQLFESGTKVNNIFGHNLKLPKIPKLLYCEVCCDSKQLFLPSVLNDIVNVIVNKCNTFYQSCLLFYVVRIQQELFLK
jgi:hypothetical protein